jgi:ketosteroid isomerase-like protein
VEKEDKMSDEQIKSSIRGFLQSMVAGDVAKSLSFLSPDPVWVNQVATLKGTQQIKTYLEWLFKTIKDYKVTENGIGIIVQGNTGIIEHNISGTTSGKKWQVPAVCIYEFEKDKIKTMRTFMDRLALAKQAAGGLIATKAVDAVIDGTQKGLKL